MPDVEYGDPRLPPRFWNKVWPCYDSDCWVWMGALTRGYGSFGIGSLKDGSRRSVLAHRHAYATLIGPLPDDLQIDHVRARGCASTACVRPEHLEPVTNRENTMRGDSGKVNAERHWAITHCPAGHEYTPDNTYVHVNARGTRRRHCRTCRKLQDARRRACFTPLR